MSVSVLNACDESPGKLIGSARPGRNKDEVGHQLVTAGKRQT